MRFNYSNHLIIAPFASQTGEQASNHMAGEVHTYYLETTREWEYLHQPAPCRSQGDQSNSHGEQGLALPKTFPLP